MKPTWQSLRKAISDFSSLHKYGQEIPEDTITEKFEILEQHLDYLLEPLFEELDALDYCLLYRIYDITGKSEQMIEGRQKVHWASLWSHFLIYRDCFFCPVYPEESFYPEEKSKQAESGIFYPSKEVLDKRTSKLKRVFASRLRKLNAHGFIDIKVGWEELEEALESSLEEKAVYIDENWIIAIRATKKGYEKLKGLGYNLKIAYSCEPGKNIEFIPPEEYPEKFMGR